MKCFFYSTCLALIFFTSSSFAQYVWLDENGHKQFSDQPPPHNTPTSKIIKTRPLPIQQDHPTSAPVAETLAEKNTAYQKRRDAQIAQAQKEAEEAKAAAAKSEYCKRTRAYKQSLDSGLRITQMNEKGERSFMNDTERLKAQNEVNQSLQTCD